MLWMRGDSAQDQNLLAAHVREATRPLVTEAAMSGVGRVCGPQQRGR